MIKLSKTAKLSLDKCQGTYKSRIEYAKNLNAKFFQKICTEFKTEEISSDIFQQNLKDIIGNKINFLIKTSDNTPFDAAVFLDLNPKNKNEADRYNIFLPINKFNNKLSVQDISTFMHETFHFFCEIANPKHTKRLISIFSKNLTDKFEDFYQKYFYNKKNYDLDEIETKILPEFLDKLNYSDKIDFLQNSRYRLKEELEAYREGAYYNNKIQNIRNNYSYKQLNCENGDSYNFQSKIDILNRALKRTLLEKTQNR